jgi:Reverse transcriptase (RNA-dependent DNA polymerase)
MIEIIKSLPKGIIIIFLGDFNASLGMDTDGIWQKTNVRGPFGTSIALDFNGPLLLEFCVNKKLFIADSFFDRPNKDFGTWRLPKDSADNIFNYALDHILVSENAHQYVKSCGVCPELNLRSDHRAVVLEFTCPRGSKKRYKNRRVGIVTSLELPPKFQTRLIKKDVNAALNIALLENSIDLQLSVIKDALWKVICEGGNMSSIYDCFESTFHNSIAGVIPYIQAPSTTNNINPGWFEKNSQKVTELLDLRRTAQANLKNNPASHEFMLAFKLCKANVQREIRLLKSAFWDDIANRLQVLFESNDSKGFSEACKIIYGPTTKGLQSNSDSSDSNVLYKRDGTLTNTEEEYIDRWVEHYTLLLNQKSYVDIDSMEAQGLLPKRSNICYALEVEFTEQETRKGIGDMKCDTAGGMDRQETEMFKFTKKSVELVPMLTKLFNCSLNQSIVPQQWKDVIITILHKKGDRKICDNFRGISLINVIGKIFERLISNRVINYCEATIGVLPASQFGFRADRSTQDCIFLSRQISSIAKEKQQTLYKCFVDLTKAYDKVNRDLLWHILEIRGFPPKLIAVIRELMVGSKAYVRVNGILADPFELECGLKQGSVFAPLLFNIFFGAIIEIFREKVLVEDGGVKLKVSRNNANIFSTIEKKIDVEEEISVLEILFADDAVLLAPSLEKLQFMVATFANVAKAYGQLVSVGKTQVLVVYPNKEQERLEDLKLFNMTVIDPDSGKQNVLVMRRFGPFWKDGNFLSADFAMIRIDDMIEGQFLDVVKHFKYVGSTESGYANMDEEVRCRVQRMLVAFAKLAPRVFENRNLPLKTKISVLKSVVIENAIYGCGAWNFTVKQISELESAQFRLLRRILRIRIRDFVSNESILNTVASAGATILPLGVIISKRRLMYLGRLMRQDGASLLSRVFRSDYITGKRSSGGQQASFNRGIIKDLECFKIGYRSSVEFTSLVSKCSDINIWRKCVDEGSANCLDRWLLDRAKAKAIRDAANEIKEKPLMDAIARGYVTVSRGGARGRYNTPTIELDW